MARMFGRSLAAAGCALLIAAGCVSLAAPAEAATTAPAQVTVIPADPPAEQQTDYVLWAGETGFLHQYSTSGALKTLWTRYTDHATNPVPGIEAGPPRLVAPAGGDVVSTALTVDGHSTPGFRTVLNLADMTWSQVPIPATGTVVGYYGGALLVFDQGALTQRRFAADGSFQDVPVTGGVADATAISALTSDGTTVVLHITSPSGIRVGLFDVASATVSLMPADLGQNVTALLSKDHVAFLRAGSPLAVRIYTRAGTDPQDVDLPAGTPLSRVGLVGDHLISALTGAAPVIDRSTGDILVPSLQTDASFGQGSTGGVVVVGGTGPLDRAVQHLTETDTGGIERTPVLPLPMPQVNAGLSMARGAVRHVEAHEVPGATTLYQVFNHEMIPSAAPAPVYSGTLVAPQPCEPGATCVRMPDRYAANRYLKPGTSTSLVVSPQFIKGTTTSTGTSVTLPSAAGTIVDSSSGYLVINGTDPVQQYIVAPTSFDAVVTRPVTGAVVWNNGLWSATSPGVLQQTRLSAPHTVIASVNTGAPCTASELQAASHYIYWSCGADGPAGVYDATVKSSIAVPAGQFLLGDGYLVRHDASGPLLRYDLTGGTLGAPVAAGSLPRGALADDRGITWAVDKFGGDIAYVDGDDAVHVVDPGVRPSAVTGTSDPQVGFVESAGPGVDTPGPGYVSAWPSRPVAGWTATYTRAGTGQVVATHSGGAVPQIVLDSWDGLLASGAKAPSGLYRLTITGTTTDDPTPETIATGTLTVVDGTPNFHSYEIEGSSGVYAVTPAGDAYWLVGDPGGQSRSVGPTTNKWTLGTTTASQSSALTPFGDFDGDGTNDLLARDGTGVLHAYPGYGTGSFSSANAISIGKGWATYNLLISAGDLNGDGHADLLGRDASGKLWRYLGTATKSFSARVQVPGTFTQPKLAGPGDLNGDGRPDLLGVDTAGILSFALGDGTGGFGAWQRIGGGWTPYTIAAAGDFNQDGRNDLAARDGAGVLWLYPGDGKGAFGVRARLGAGYQQYAVIA